MTPKSRADVPEYADMERELSTLVGQINGRHGDPAWTPIRYVNRSYSRASLAGLYRSAQVGLVTPLRDGMNLVAKEYVAAQDPEDPGVLVLSQFAGAAEELDGALIVNPHDRRPWPRPSRKRSKCPCRSERNVTGGCSITWRRMTSIAGPNVFSRRSATAGNSRDCSTACAGYLRRARKRRHPSSVSLEPKVAQRATQRLGDVADPA